MMCSTETPKLPEISSEQSVLSQEGARVCVEDLPESVNTRLKLSISPVSSVSGGTFFFPFIYHHSEANLEGNDLILSESIQKGRKGLPNCVLTFLTSAILLKEREKRNKTKSVQSRFFCFLFAFG